MAKRIYDQTLGQLAGVQVTTDGLGNIVRDGTEAYAQMVVSASGQPISSTAGTGNLVSLSGATVAAGSISFSANADYAIIDTQGFEGAAFTVSGFGTATLAVQWSNLAASGFTSGTVSTVGSSTTGTTITGNGQYTAAAGGRYMKILVTAFTTGPIVVTPVLISGSSVGGGGGASGAVNITQVAGASVTAAAGAVAAGTMRTTLASNDPAVVALQAMQAATGPVLAPSAATPVKGAITTAMTGTTSTSLLAAPGAALYNYITTIVVSNGHASVGTNILIQDGNGGTTMMTIPAAANYGGAVITLPVPLKQTTANTALYAQNETTGSSTKVSCVGYTGA